ncbi:hypothetical protein, partial [Escherichia coli]|uniref:hypothetical protein n=1 Tax=Escherichia coli TaxID=562 RepID=UPI001A902771
KRAYCLKTQPATGETYPKSDLFNKAKKHIPSCFSKETSISEKISFFIYTRKKKTTKQNSTTH